MLETLFVRYAHIPRTPLPCTIYYPRGEWRHRTKARSTSRIHATLAHFIQAGRRRVGVPKAEDGRILESIGSLTWTTSWARPYSTPTFSENAEMSFVLPTTAEALYLISHGSYQTGKVEVEQSTMTGRGGNVRVGVRVAYHNERARMCDRISTAGMGMELGSMYVLSLFPPSALCPHAHPFRTSRRHG